MRCPGCGDPAEDLFCVDCAAERRSATQVLFQARDSLNGRFDREGAFTTTELTLIDEAAQALDGALALIRRGTK